jgi:hypothetical protein
MPRPLRSLLLFALVLGLIGTEAELLLLEHFEGAWQWVPIILIGVALLSLLAHAVRPSPSTVRAIQILMGCFVVSGVLGTFLHYQGNANFELEITPDIPGLTLFKAAMEGATPVLAPGSMIQLGLIGLAWTFRHPATTRETSTNSSQVERS